MNVNLASGRRPIADHGTRAQGNSGTRTGVRSSRADAELKGLRVPRLTNEEQECTIECPRKTPHARLPFPLSRAHGYEGSCGQCSADVELSSGSHSAQGASASLTAACGETGNEGAGTSATPA